MLAPFRVLISHRQAIQIFVNRDIRGRYINSALGLWWAVIQPLALLALYTFVFSGIMSVRLNGSGSTGEFALYAFCGLLPWLAVRDALTRSASVLLDQTPLIKKVVFPSEILPVHLVLSALVVEIVGLVVFLAVVIVGGRLPGWSLLLLPIVIALQFFFMTGIAWLLATLAVYLRDVRQVVGLVLTLWMFLTPIVYPASLVPARFQWVLDINPMTADRRCLSRRAARRPAAGAGSARRLCGGRVHRVRIWSLGVHAYRSRRSPIFSDGLIAIEVDRVSKAYRLYPTPRHRALELLTFGAKTYHTNFWAVSNVSLRVPAGATLGLVGNNGSGKSTLLQLIAGIVSPTSGQVRVSGRISSLLELGAGFNPEFTGRENVELYGMVMGMSREETAERLPAIQAFAGIGEFIDRPVKSYSSGMFVRLAFSAAIHVKPDILLVDEALAVGDIVFQHQCIRRIREMQAAGTTIVFVSHDMGMMRSICTEAVLLEGGQIVAHDDPATIADIYHAKTASIETAERVTPRAARPNGDGTGPVAFRAEPGFDERVRLFRHGTGAAQIR